jgi:N-acetylneuraminate synthase
MVTVIAEAGVNHNGRLDLALALVDAAAEAGADIVKFQTFKASALVTKAAAKAGYQRETTGSDGGQLDMLRALKLDLAAHQAIVARCRQKGIAFLSTPFDADSLRLLVDDLGADRLKIGSGDMNNAPHVLAMARTGCDLIVSTGMATIDEIEEALGVIAFGLAGWDAQPSRPRFAEARRDPAARRRLADKVVLLHCTTAYPTPPESVNLRAMSDLARRLELPVGFSDHSEGIAIPIVAAALSTACTAPIAAPVAGRLGRVAAVLATASWRGLWWRGRRLSRCRRRSAGTGRYCDRLCRRPDSRASV